MAGKLNVRFASEDDIEDIVEFVNKISLNEILDKNSIDNQGENIHQFRLNGDRITEAYVENDMLNEQVNWVLLENLELTVFGVCKLTSFENFIKVTDFFLADYNNFGLFINNIEIIVHEQGISEIIVECFHNNDELQTSLNINGYSDIRGYQLSEELTDMLRIIKPIMVLVFKVILISVFLINTNKLTHKFIYTEKLFYR